MMQITTYTVRLPLMFAMVALTAVLALALPQSVEAQEGWFQAVQCGGEGEPICQFCHIVEIGNSIIIWLIGVLFVIFAVIMVVAGFQLLTSGGNQVAKQAAKNRVTNAVVGFIIVLAAWLVVDTIMRALLAGGEGMIDGRFFWAEVQCLDVQRPTAGTPEEFELRERASGNDFYTERNQVTGGSFGQDGFVGFTGSQRGSATVGNCEVAASGPCSESALRVAGFGALSGDAARIVGAESGCNPLAHSRTDTTTDGRTTSVGTWQVHMPAHQVNCGGTTLDCPSAFVSSGQRNQYNVRTYRVVNESLYQQCVRALENPECNNQIAARLANASGDMGDWACSARRCGVSTSRNHLCPL